MTDKITSSDADAAPPLPADEGLQLAGVSPSRPKRSLRVRLLEYFLVLFALYGSGTFHLAYRLTQGPLRVGHSFGFSDWIQYFLEKACALGILGYVLFRNSRWCAAHTTPTQLVTSNPRASDGDSDRLRMFELLLVLIVAFAGSILYSFQIFVGSQTLPSVSIISPARYGYEMLDYAGAVGLLGYVLTRSSRGFQDLGLRWTSRDVAIALPLTLVALFAGVLLSPLIYAGAGVVSGQQAPDPNIGRLLLGTSISIAAVPIQIANGVFEEMLVRGYLMTEVKRFTGSILLAILCSVAVQVSYHFYQGGRAALSHIACFMVFAGYYAKTNRLLPPVLAHIAIDLNSLVMYGLSSS
ncbi:membrane hypothetical protein [Verrucomicrobia bacterium]|nr:membrane hypothetical protein [Verrucomicrobiota bacterium]